MTNVQTTRKHAAAMSAALAALQTATTQADKVAAVRNVERARRAAMLQR